MAKKKKEAEEETALAEQEETGLALPEYDDDDLGAGYEHQTSADTRIPFIVMLQALSPIVVEGKAKAGQFMNTVTGQIFDQFLFVPGTTRRYFAEWVPRNQGGGFRGHHEVNSPEVKKAIAEATKFGRNKSEDGNDLVDTFYVYGIACDEEGEADSMAGLAFAKTKIKHYKNWMGSLRGVTIRQGGKRKHPPLYGNLCLMTSELERGTEGDYYVIVPKPVNERGWKWSLIGPDDERFQLAKQVRKLVDQGDADIDPGQQAAQGTPGADIPF